MPDTPTGSTRTYKVHSIDELTRVKKGGGIEKYYRHRIETAKGTFITVDIDEIDFVPEKAEKMLAEKAQNADRIKG